MQNFFFKYLSGCRVLQNRACLNEMRCKPSIAFVLVKTVVLVLIAHVIKIMHTKIRKSATILHIVVITCNERPSNNKIKQQSQNKNNIHPIIQHQCLTHIAMSDYFITINLC